MKQNFDIKPKKTNTFETNDVKLAYDIVVPESEVVPQKQILLLINGFQRTRQDFRAFRQKLARECPDTITIAFDNRFCGETEVQKKAEETSLNDFAQDALLLLTHCMSAFQITKVHVLGISMGGMIAQLLANLKNCPQLQTLFLVSTSAGGKNRVWPTKELLQEKHMDADLTYDDISSRLKLYFGEKFLKSSPLLLKMFIQNMQKTLTSPSAQEAVSKQALASKSFDGIKDFNQLAVQQIVIVSGDEDHILPLENSTIMHHIMPNSQLIVYPQIGHLILIENPNQFVQDIAQFLKPKEPSLE